MKQIDKILAGMRNNSKNVRFDDLVKVCEHFFGKPRQRGSSHMIFKMLWCDDPRVNIQCGRDGKAKVYQVKQVLAAIDRLEHIKHEQAATLYVPDYLVKTRQ
jgi:hypothetical protein